MADAIIERVPTRTHTIDRQWEDTETRKQVVGKNVPDLLQAIAWILRRFWDVAIEPSCGVRATFDVSRQKQADLTSKTSTFRLLDGGQQAISAIASVARERGACLASPQVDQHYKRFQGRLIATLIDEPIEDGVTHRAEQVIDEALRTNSSECRAWLSRALAEHYQHRPSISASIIRCIGRIDYEEVGQWGLGVVEEALRNEDAEVREAAIRALEAWGGREALVILRRHRDSVTWLDEYVSQVIVDLSGITS